MERLQINIDGELKKRFKLACVEDSEEMTDILTRLIERWLAERKSRTTAGRR
jgi:hypothetical protein